VVVSNDISCLMHIGGMLQRNPATRHIRTTHIAEVLVAGWEGDGKRTNVEKQMTKEGRMSKVK